MSEQTFYRGSVGGRGVVLAVSHLPAGSAEALMQGLAFAKFVPKPARGKKPALTIEVVGTAAAAMAIADAPSQPASQGAATSFQRDLTPEIRLCADLAARRALFQVALHADATLWLPRVRSEILHLFGLFTPTLALHASCVVTAKEKSAWVFCGPSGAGKTTISTVLLKALPLVDEEIVLVDLSTAAPQILNTPSAGPPLAIARLFQLKQAAACSVEKLSSGEFIAKNMTRPFDLAVPEFLNERMEKMAKLTEALRPRELRFNLHTYELLGALGC